MNNKHDIIMVMDSLNLKYRNVVANILYVVFLMWLLYLMNLGFTFDQLLTLGYYCFVVTIMNILFDIVKYAFHSNFFSGILIVALSLGPIIGIYSFGLPALARSLEPVGGYKILVFIIITIMSLIPSVLAKFNGHTTK